MIRCPVCRRRATRLQPSPASDPHVVAVYPCGCWLTPAQARQVCPDITDLADRLGINTEESP